MRCVSTGDLRAYLDRELDADKMERVELHLDECPRCRDVLGDMLNTAQFVEMQVSAASERAVAASEGDSARLRQRWAEQERMAQMRKSRMWRPMLAGVVAVAMLVGVFSFAPTRAAARKLLSVFRVRRFAVVQIDPSQASHLESLEGILPEPIVVADEPTVQVDSIEEAREAAGVDVRMPSYWPGVEPPSIEIKGRSEIAMDVTADSLRLVLEMAGMDPDQVPADWAGGRVYATAPAAAHIGDDDLQVIQVFDPTIEYPEGIDPGLVGEAGLRLLGLDPEQARSISQSIDWTQTLLLPIPIGAAEIRETVVGGEPALFMRPLEQNEDDQSALIWESDGIIYVVTGRMSRLQLLQVAESLSE